MTLFATQMRLKRLTGNKKDNLTIIYTPADNLKVSYRSQKKYLFHPSTHFSRKRGTWL